MAVAGEQLCGVQVALQAGVCLVGAWRQCGGRLPSSLRPRHPALEGNLSSVIETSPKYTLVQGLKTIHIIFLFYFFFYHFLFLSLPAFPDVRVALLLVNK
jgi:hypothetical protein